jgi:hypothetical protein
LSLPKLTSLLFSALLLARPVVAQDTPPSTIPAASIGEFAPWEPLGLLPVDQAGAGLRGYSLPGESTDVTQPGANQLTVHTVVANNFYREQTTDLLISQRYETHTVALGYRRGFKVGSWPLFELGGQIQLNERDSGFLNGFISSFEGLWSSVTGDTSAKNQLRTNPARLPPLGTFVTRNGRPIYSSAGDGSGFGDVSFIAKALLRDAAPSSTDMRVAARFAMNLSGKSDFTEGNFAGIGVSMDKKFRKWAAVHGDVRGSVLLDRVSSWDLPLRRTSFGFSVGPELKLARHTSASLQIDGSTTPYLPTGTMGFDKGYGDITLGVGHRFTVGRHQVLTQGYLRENMNLPFRVRWNLDPDLSVGLKATIH